VTDLDAIDPAAATSWLSAFDGALSRSDTRAAALLCQVRGKASKNLEPQMNANERKQQLRIYTSGVEPFGPRHRPVLSYLFAFIFGSKCLPGSSKFPVG
jgi:hypothetical protein